MEGLGFFWAEVIRKSLSSIVAARQAARRKIFSGCLDQVNPLLAGVPALLRKRPNAAEQRNDAKGQRTTFVKRPPTQPLFLE